MKVKKTVLIKMMFHKFPKKDRRWSVVIMVLFYHVTKRFRSTLWWWCRVWSWRIKNRISHDFLVAPSFLYPFVLRRRCVVHSPLSQSGVWGVVHVFTYSLGVRPWQSRQVVSQCFSKVRCVHSLDPWRWWVFCVTVWMHACEEEKEAKNREDLRRKKRFYVLTNLDMIVFLDWVRLFVY